MVLLLAHISLLSALALVQKSVAVLGGRIPVPLARWWNRHQALASDLVKEWEQEKKGGRSTLKNQTASLEAFVRVACLVTSPHFPSPCEAHPDFVAESYSKRQK